MIVGTGIDIVEIERFAAWHSYSKKQLTKIYAPHEIEYCLTHQKKSAERFAVRFAVKEAFFKALIAATGRSFPLLTACKAAALTYDAHARPYLAIDWPILGYSTAPYTQQCSVSHSMQSAVAVVILQTDITATAQ